MKNTAEQIISKYRRLARTARHLARLASRDSRPFALDTARVAACNARFVGKTHEVEDPDEWDHENPEALVAELAMEYAVTSIETSLTGYRNAILCDAYRIGDYAKADQIERTYFPLRRAKEIARRVMEG